MMNKYMVGALGRDLVIMRAPGRMTRDDAIGLAAWLFVMADASLDERENAVRAVSGDALPDNNRTPDEEK